MKQKVKQSKNRISKKASVAVMGLAALGIVGVSGLGVSALSGTSGKPDGLASRIATKFGLNDDEVSQEIESYKQEEHSKREAAVKTELSANLQKKVDDGTITAEQKTAVELKLEEKHKEKEAEREANKNSGTRPTREEMKTKMDAEKAEMDAWLKEQGINLDLKDVMPARNKGGPDRMRGGE